MKQPTLSEREQFYLRTGECGTKYAPHIKDKYTILGREIIECKICKKPMEDDSN